MSITWDSDVRQQSISAAGVATILAGTPLSSYAGTVEALATKYGIDANWIVSYLQWENGFGTANSFSLSNNNPWDILCYPEQWGSSGCNDPGNGYSYAVYPDMAIGLEAGFRLWASYVAMGLTTWGSSLSRAECGQATCPGNWVENVIATGDSNSVEYPADSGYTPPVPTLGETPTGVGVLLLLGGAMIAGAAYLEYRGLLPRRS